MNWLLCNNTHSRGGGFFSICSDGNDLTCELVDREGRGGHGAPRSPEVHMALNAAGDVTAEERWPTSPSCFRTCNNKEHLDYNTSHCRSNSFLCEFHGEAHTQGTCRRSFSIERRERGDKICQSFTSVDLTWKATFIAVDMNLYLMLFHVSKHFKSECKCSRKNRRGFCYHFLFKSQRFLLMWQICHNEKAPDWKQTDKICLCASWPENLIIRAKWSTLRHREWDLRSLLFPFTSGDLERQWFKSLMGLDHVIHTGVFSCDTLNIRCLSMYILLFPQAREILTNSLLPWH